MTTVYRNGLRAEFDDLWTKISELITAVRRLGSADGSGGIVADLNAILRRSEYSAAMTVIEDGTTDGKLATEGPTFFKIAGRIFTKEATDDLWDLSGKTDTTGAQYRAHWLYLDASGTATVVDGTTTGASAAAAIAALPAQDTTKSVIGVYVAGPSCDYNGAAGLAAQGAIYAGMPTALTLTTTAIDTDDVTTVTLVGP